MKIKFPKLPTEAWVLFATALLMIPFIPNAIRQIQARDAIEQQKVEKLAAIKQQELNQIQIIENRKAANQRLEQGCIPVIDAKTAKNLVTLVEGQPILDRTSKSYLPAGAIVCGANGEVGITTLNKQGVPVVTNILVGDRALMYKSLKKIKGAKVFYNVPMR